MITRRRVRSGRSRLGPMIMCIAVAAALPGRTAAAATDPAWVTDPAALVNPFIGTQPSCSRSSCDGLDVPGAYVPFGMMQWGPVTSSGGYSYTDSSFVGYALTSVSGCGGGCAAADNIPILPMTGSLGSDPSATTEPLNHSEETASPGYYRLTSDGVTSRLTDTTRAGIATFAFPAGHSANLLFQLAHNSPVTTDFQVLSDREVQGSVTRAFSNPSTAPNPHPSYTLHFDMVFNHAFTSYGTWTAGSAPTNGRALPRMAPQPPVNGAAGAVVTFGADSHETITAKVGISYVSGANAVLNRRTEEPGWSFSAVRSAAYQTWNAMLSRVRIGGGTPAEQTVFYTALYHALLFPSVFSDVNGQYMGWDGKVHTVARGHASYANFSGWDVYRSDIQLEAMLAPRRMSDIVRSMLEDYTQTGQLPQWSANHMERYIMLGDPADAIIADAYAFGARDFNAQTALRDMVTQATVPGVMRPGLARYEQDGYIPYDGGPYPCCNFRGVVSAQLEYNADDYSIAELAHSLGQDQLAASFAIRAQNWQNSFDPATGFLQPKASDGVFRSANTPSVPYGASGFFDSTNTAFFADGDKYVYTAMLPFDVQGIIDAEGGPGAWVRYLDALSSNITSQGATNIQMTNEPSTDIPWEYDYAGAAYKTQALVREIQGELYTDQPGGMPGNDDQGELSSWYVWSAVGLYPETPGSANLVLGSPLFPKIEIHLGGGSTIVENAPSAAPDAPYVHGLTINGRSWGRAYLPQNMVVPGSHRPLTLDWSLGTAPDPAWASGSSDAPPSQTQGLLPALGFLGTGSNSETLFIRPGSSRSLQLGVQNMTTASQQVTWTASTPPGSGLTVVPARGTLNAASEAKVIQSVTLTTAATPTHGEYLVTFHFRAENGTALPDVAAAVGVDPIFDNVAISNDTAQSAANFDTTGYSYSEQALTAAGLAPGDHLTSGGVSYIWPDVAAGTPDNVIAAGQTIPLSAPAGATTLGFLGASDRGTTSTRLTITYTDGTVETVTLGFGDWVLGGSSGNTTVAVMPYRNWATGTPQTLKAGVHVFSSTVPLEPDKTVASVTLPTPGGTSRIHIFAIGTNKGPVASGI